MQTILGAGGAIGRELAKALKEYPHDIRLVSRHPEKVNPDDKLMSADLLNRGEVHKAVQGASVAYLTVGLPYDIEVWEKDWPLIMENVLSACKEHNCRLVFFDNIYMYDENHLDGMTEETPVNPPSRKGAVRARIADRLMDEVQKGEIEALIARSADFYGPGIKETSMLTEMVINPLSDGNKANWIGSAAVRHSFTYTPDAGKATAILGNTAEAYNEVWHLPTAPDPLTGKEWIEAVARAMDTDPRYRKVSKWMLRIMGFFVPVMGEIVEMYYQYDRDYVFDSSKFEQRFDFIPTSYEEGIKETIKTRRTLDAA